MSHDQDPDAFRPEPDQAQAFRADQPSGAPQPAMAGASYGGIGKRIIARILDSLIVGIPVGLVLTVLPGVRPGDVMYSLIGAVAALAYFVVMETSSGATLGKQLLGLRVTDAAGGTVTTDASLRRNWWMLLSGVSGIPFVGWLAGLASLVVVIVIIATISSDPANRGWHDRLGDTYVLERS